MKVVINSCYGGFDFSEEFKKFYLPAKTCWDGDIRTDSDLIKALEEFGLDKASGDFACLEIVEIPDRATDWTINEYDGSESVIAVVDGKLHYY